MILKPENIIMAAFDVFQKPSGKKKFITRRQITRTSKPLLSEKHLPTLAPGRGKKCFSASYINIYKSTYKIKKDLEFTPLFRNVFLHAEEIKEIKNYDISEIQNHKRNPIPFINQLNIASKYCVNNANFSICLEKSEFFSKIPDLLNKLALSKVKSNQERYFKVMLYSSSHTNDIYNNALDIKPCKGIISNQKHSEEKYYKHFNFSLPEKACISFRDSLTQCRFLNFNEIKFDIFDFIYITETEDCFVYNSKERECNVRLTEANSCSNSLLFITKPYKEVLFKYSCDILPVYTRNEIHSLSSTTGIIGDNFTQKNFKFLEHFGKSQPAQIIKRKAVQTAILQSKIKQKLTILENKQGINLEKKDLHFKFQTISNFIGNYLNYSYKNSLKAEYSLPNISEKLISSTVKFTTSIIKPSKFKNIAYKNLNAPATPTLKNTAIYSKKDIINTIGFKTKKHKMFFKGALHAKYTLRATKTISSIKDFRIKYKNKKSNIYTFVEKNKLLRTKSNYEFSFSMPHKRKFRLHDNTLKMVSLYSKQSFTKVCLGKNVKKVKQQTPSKFRYFHSQHHVKSNFSSLYKIFETYSFCPTSFIGIKRIFLYRKEICDIAKSAEKRMLVHSSYFSNLNDCLLVNDFKFIFYNLIKHIKHVYPEPAMLLIGLTKSLAVNHLCLNAYSESIKNYLIPQEFKTVIKAYKCKTHLNPYPFGFPSFAFLPDNYKCISNKTFLALKSPMVCSQVYSDNFIIKNERIYRHPLSLKAPQKFIFSAHEKLIHEPDYYCSQNQMPTSRLSIIKLSIIRQSWEIAQFSSKIRVRKLFKMQKSIIAERLLFANRFTFLKQAIYSNEPNSELAIKRTPIKPISLRANTELLVFSRNEKFIINNETKSKFSFFTETTLTIPKQLSVVSQYLNFNVKSNFNFYFSQSSGNKLTQLVANNYKSTFRTFRFPYKPESNSTILKHNCETKIVFKNDQFLSNEHVIIYGKKISKFFFKRLNLVKFNTDEYRGLDNKHTCLIPSKHNYVNALTNWLSYISPIEYLYIKNANYINIFPLSDSNNKPTKIMLMSKMKYLKPNPDYIFAYYPHYPELESEIKLNDYLNDDLNINKIENTNLLLNKIHNTIKLSILPKYLINESNKYTIKNVFKDTALVMAKANFYESKMTFSKLIQNRKELNERIDKKENIMLKDIQIKNENSTIYNQDIIFKYTVLHSSEPQVLYSQKKEHKETKLFRPQTQMLSSFRELASNDFTENFNYKINVELLKKDQLNNEIDTASAVEKNELRCQGIPDWIDMQPFNRLKRMPLLAQSVTTSVTY